VGHRLRPGPGAGGRQPDAHRRPGGHRQHLFQARRLVIGNTFFKLGKLPQAEQHLRKALELRRAALGAEHPDTLAAQEDLAWFLCGGLRRYDEAEPLSRQTWEARRRVLGPEDADTLNSMDTYGSVLGHLGRLAEAEQLMRQCWEARQHVLGKDNVDTLTTQGNLGFLLVEQGRWEEVVAILEECLRERRRLWGTDRDGAPTNNLAAALLGLGKLREAEDLLVERVKGMAELRGEDHPNTLHLRHQLVRVLEAQGRHAEAEKQGRTTLDLRRKVLPAGHENIGRSQLILGHILVEEGRHAEAEEQLREALAVFAKACPHKKALGAEAESWLGACLVARGSYREAEPLLVGSYEILRAEPGLPSADKAKALERIVGLYDAWGKPEKANEWRRQREPAGPEPDRRAAREG
jgi:tetratricopeptide (TPR) repeat protein